MSTFLLRRLFAGELDTDRRVLAESEVSSMTEVLSGLELERDVVLDITLASDVEPHVNAAQQSISKAGGPLYASRGKAGQAEGITLFGDGGDAVHVSIILQHDRWLTDDTENVVLRWFLLLHELMHVIQRATGVGANHEDFDEATCTYRENVAYQARKAYDEYDADKRADELSRHCLRAVGVHAGASEFFLDGYAGSAATLLVAMSDFVRSEVLPYRNDGGDSFLLGLDAHKLVRELFKVLPHAVALADAVEAMDGLTDALMPQPGFSTYLGPDWTAFIGAMRAGSGAQAEPELSRIWTNVMARIGLNITNGDDGALDIHVVEPLLP